MKESELAISTVKDTVTTASIFTHIRENRIEYLLAIGLLHLLGISDRVLTHASGICWYYTPYVQKSSGRVWGVTTALQWSPDAGGDFSTEWLSLYLCVYTVYTWRDYIGEWKWTESGHGKQFPRYIENGMQMSWQCTLIMFLERRKSNDSLHDLSSGISWVQEELHLFSLLVRARFICP